MSVARFPRESEGITVFPGRREGGGLRLVVDDFTVRDGEELFSSRYRPELRSVPSAPGRECSEAREPAPHSEVSSLRFGWILRSALVAICAALLVVAGLAVGSMMGPSANKDVVVQSGDTLWSIAERVEGAPDTATAVADIVALNGLSSESIAPGQSLRLPSY